MRKMIKYLFAAALLAVSVSNISAQKFGYVNSQLVLEELPEVKAADAEIKTLQQQMQKKGQEMFQSYQNKAVELQQRRDQGELSPKQLEEEAKKLGLEEEKIRNYETKMQTDILQKQQSLLQPIQTKVNDAITAVAKEGGYTFIFDISSGLIMYAEESADVTELVKAKLQ